MKVTLKDTQEEAIGLKHEVFNLGAPFTAVLFNNYWDEETKRVYQSSAMEGLGVDCLEDEFPHEDKWAVKHIEEYVFAPYTYGYYMEAYPDNVAIQERVPKDELGEPDEEWLEKTPAQYVSEVLIGADFTTIELP